ncbi:glycosyltransferase family 39 protein [Haloarcula sp. S1CR25-12]|uniref:Glycosyltransferase family 39 protein n=1 Tax=Haloarcula saliterrae TaxID=2950534 RepID=A0ABU2F8G5_9EURY|nr:glycosyltransferase family 39 protein [Haloarcula sp. S1CR25-12]MDS0258557.1 glycosyltransferase family 39 protein [Haloarcula sp. S1CR25-12]
MAVQSWLDHFSENTREVYAVLGILIIGSATYIRDLGSFSLIGWDESLYALVVRSIVENGHWIAPRLQFLHRGPIVTEPFMEKPPFVFWVQAVSVTVLGDSEFALRLPSALATIATAIVIYWFLRRYSVGAGLFGAVSFLTMPYVFAGFNAGRTGSTDALFVFFGTLALCTLWVATADDRRDIFYVGAGATVLMLLSKGFAAGVFAIIALPVLAVRWKWLWKNRVPAATATVVATVAVLAWPTVMYMRYGDPFINIIFINHVVERAASYSTFPFVQAFPAFTDPWLFVVPAAVVARFRSQMERLLVFSVWWVVAVLAFFSLTAGGPWYIAPAFPGLAVAVGIILDDAVSRTPRRAVAVLICLGLGLLISPRLPIQLVPVVTNGLRSPPSGLRYLLGIGVFSVVVGFGLVRQLDLWPENIDWTKSQLIGLVLAGLLLSAPVAISGSWAVNEGNLGKSAHEHTSPDATVYLADGVIQNHPPNWYGFSYYSERSISRVPLSDVKSGMVIVVPESRLNELQCEYTVLDQQPIAGAEFALLEIDCSTRQPS